jgi:hypothetical protein
MAVSRNDASSERQFMSLGEDGRGSSRRRPVRAWMRSAALMVLAAAMTACGAGPQRQTLQVGTPPPAECNGSDSARPPATAAAKRAVAYSSPPQGLSPITPQFFGMHVDVQALPGGNPPLPWPTFPFGTIRMHDTETSWNEIQTSCSPANYDFTMLDQWRTLYQLNEATNPAGNYRLLFTIYSTPVCISSNPDFDCNFSSGGNNIAGTCEPPSDLDSTPGAGDGKGPDTNFINFLVAFEQHLAATSTLPQIHDFEIWNEPNNYPFWNGNMTQLARMAQDARCVIKGEDCSRYAAPSLTGLDTSALMHTPPPVTTTDETSTNLNSPSGWLTAYWPYGGLFADIVDFHGYVEPGDPVEGVLTVAQSVQQAVASTNLPIWDTELGYSTADVCDPYTQAGWLAKAYLLQPGAGISSVDWFEYGATNVGTLYNFGVGENTAANDYGVLYSWLEGATPTGSCTNPSGTVWTCDFTLAGGAQAEAVWDSSQSCKSTDGTENCTTSNFTPKAVYTQYLDLQGGNSVPVASGSTVPIGVEPILLESQ